MIPEFLFDKARQKPVHCPNKIYFCKISFTWVLRFRNKDKAKEEFLKFSSKPSVPGQSLPHSWWGAHILCHCALSVLTPCLLSPTCPPCKWRLLAGSPHPCSPRCPQDSATWTGPWWAVRTLGTSVSGSLLQAGRGPVSVTWSLGPAQGGVPRSPTAQQLGSWGGSCGRLQALCSSSGTREGAWGSRGAEGDPQGAPLRAPPSVLHLKLSLIAEDPLGFGLMLTV